MPEPGDRVPADGNHATPDTDNRKIPPDIPELTEEVQQAGIPVLDRQVTGTMLEDSVPALDETFKAFDKTIPVLEEAAESLPDVSAPVKPDSGPPRQVETRDPD